MDQASYFRSHPPRCIAKFATQPVEFPDVQFDGHGSVQKLNFDVPEGIRIEGPELINSVFAISCRCGSTQHYVHCYLWTNPGYPDCNVTLSPLVLECAACHTKSELLDTDIHGYDAEMGHGSVTVRAQGDSVVFECARCGPQPLEAFVRFEYSDDLFDPDFPEFSGREQDLFSWFTLLGKCPQCCSLLNIADFECA